MSVSVSVVEGKRERVQGQMEIFSKWNKKGKESNRGERVTKIGYARESKIKREREGGHSGHFLGKWCKSIFGKKF